MPANGSRTYPDDYGYRGFKQPKCQLGRRYGSKLMSDIKDALSIIRKSWSKAPVPIYAIIHELGLGPVYRSLPQNISGAIERTNSERYQIVINSDQSLTRQRFTAAHELGHYIYHRDLLGLGVGDTLAFRAYDTPLPNPNITPTHERQANNFAANVLMPAHLIDALKARGITTPKEIADHLLVSEEAMRIRLNQPRLAGT